MSILITGGAGFIGSQLAYALRQRGERLILLDNFNTYYDPALKRANVAPFADDPLVTVIEGDVRDTALIDQVMVEYGVRKIAHMAAMAGVRSSIEQAPLYFEVNLLGSIHLLEAARKHQVEQFIQSSTSSVYGETARIPFTEDDAADRPLASYSASKRAAEMAAHSYHHLFGLNVTCLRFFNVYGPHGRPDMMPMRIMRSILEHQPITLFNEGKFSRDWTYIDDVVNGIIAALDKPLGYQLLNLGCGAPLSMNAFLDIMEELSQQPIQRVNVPTPLSEPPITYCNNQRARDLLGFEPRVDLLEGLNRTWSWYQQVHSSMKTSAKESSR